MVLCVLGHCNSLSGGGASIYVGTGYRILSDDMKELLGKVDGVLLHKDDTPYGEFL